MAHKREKVPVLYRVHNETRDVVIGTTVELAGHSGARTKGLLGRDSLAPGSGLWIVPCEGVHTFGMRFPIDLLYIDKKHRVRKIRHSVPRNRISLCLTAHSVLELPAGTLSDGVTQVGDQVVLRPAADANDMGR